MQQRDFDLLVIGEINADLIVSGSDLTPEFGQVEKLVEEASLTIGSSSVITACGAARLGLRTAFIGVVGDDPVGHFMLEAMAKHRIDTSACIVENSQATGISIILNDASREQGRAILTAPGTIGALTADQISSQMLAKARHIHCGSYYLQPGLQRGLTPLFRKAGTMGLTRSIDTNWDPSGKWNGELRDVLSACDLFFPNEEELLRITGSRELGPALDKLTAGDLTTVVKLGPKGAAARKGQTCMTVPAPGVEVMDTTGAGDSFNAGLLYGFLEGWRMDRSLALAVACGSLSTRALGGTAGQPTLEEATEVASGIQATSRDQ